MAVVNILGENTMRRFIEFLQEDDGPTAVEYAVMLAFIVLATVASILALGESMSDVFESISRNTGG